MQTSKGISILAEDMKEDLGKVINFLASKVNVNDLEVAKSATRLSRLLECETCGGERTIPKMEQVWPGEVPMADTGTQPCPDCQGEDDSDMSGAE
jgi:hypothetical protein